eukprot:1137322-Pelagomonas_calceolata.AAC.4
MEVPPVLSLLCLLYILVEHATCLQLEVHDGNYKGPPTQALGFCLLSSTSYIMVIKLVTWYMPYEVNCFVDAISFQRVLTRPSGGGGLVGAPECSNRKKGGIVVKNESFHPTPFSRIYPQVYSSDRDAIAKEMGPIGGLTGSG